MSTPSSFLSNVTAHLFQGTLTTSLSNLRIEFPGTNYLQKKYTCPKEKPNSWLTFLIASLTEMRTRGNTIGILLKSEESSRQNHLVGNNSFCTRRFLIFFLKCKVFGISQDKMNLAVPWLVTLETTFYLPKWWMPQSSRELTLPNCMSCCQEMRGT